MTRARFAIAAVAAALVAGCASSAPAEPKPPAADIRAEVRSAEDAELARRHDLARERYEQAVTDAVASGDPNREGYARREYANTLASWGELAAAIAQLERAVVNTPDDPRPWQDLGVLRSVQRDPAGARTALVRAKTLLPTSYRPRVALAALLWKTGDKPAALAEYRELLALDLPDRLRVQVEKAVATLSSAAP